jgi:energy-coupling factor transporter transmembrane protein EcfT
MTRKALPNPRITIWKAILAPLYLWAVFTFFGWLFKFISEPGRYSGFNSNPPSFPPFPPLTVGNVLSGSLWVLIYWWLYWAWKPRRKHARWLRWLGGLALGIYVSVQVLLGAIASWNVLLSHPWNLVVNSVLVLLLISAWILPGLSYRWSEKIADAQDTLGLRMLAFGSPAALMVAAGILGSTFGMSASRRGEVSEAVL